MVRVREHLATTSATDHWDKGVDNDIFQRKKTYNVTKTLKITMRLYVMNVFFTFHLLQNAVVWK